MCTKTKTSFGCGHCIKHIEHCGDRECNHIDRWEMPKPNDCPQCREVGASSTRGKQGRGRSALIIARESKKQAAVAASGGLGLTYSSSPDVWLPSTPNEKMWNSPSRKKVDRAWEREHARRMTDLSDLETIMATVQLRGEEVDIDADFGDFERVPDVHDFERDSRAIPKPSRSIKSDKLPFEICDMSRPECAQHQHFHAHSRSKESRERPWKPTFSRPAHLRRSNTMPTPNYFHDEWSDLPSYPTSVPYGIDTPPAYTYVSSRSPEERAYWTPSSFSLPMYNHVYYPGVEEVY